MFKFAINISHRIGYSRLEGGGHSRFVKNLDRDTVLGFMIGATIGELLSLFAGFVGLIGFWFGVALAVLLIILIHRSS